MGMKLYSVQLQEKQNRGSESTADNMATESSNIDAVNSLPDFEIHTEIAFITCMLEPCLQEPGEATELTEYGKHHYDVLIAARDSGLSKENEQVKLALEVFQNQRHLAYKYTRVSTPAAAPVRSRRRDRAGQI